jgi:hypothetical protein
VTGYLYCCGTSSEHEHHSSEDALRCTIKRLEAEVHGYAELRSYLGRLKVEVGTNATEVFLGLEKRADRAERERDDLKVAFRAEHALCRMVGDALKTTCWELRCALEAEIKKTPCGPDCVGGGYHHCYGCSDRAKAALSSTCGEKTLAVVHAARELDAGIGVELDDDRLKYIVAQVNREAWKALKAALARYDEAQKT